MDLLNLLLGGLLKLFYFVKLYIDCYRGCNHFLIRVFNWTIHILYAFLAWMTYKVGGFSLFKLNLLLLIWECLFGDCELGLLGDGGHGEDGLVDVGRFKRLKWYNFGLLLLFYDIRLLHCLYKPCFLVLVLLETLHHPINLQSCHLRRSAHRHILTQIASLALHASLAVTSMRHLRLAS